MLLFWQRRLHQWNSIFLSAGYCSHISNPSCSCPDTDATIVLRPAAGAKSEQQSSGNQPLLERREYHHVENPIVAAVVD